MRVLYLYCHPLPESFHAAIRTKALDGLKAAGHEVDLLDLYADKFEPVLSEDARRRYHDVSRNQSGLEGYVQRLRAAEALVVQFPVWCFGMPAMLKGFFDRVIMPGVAFDISDPAHVTPMLGNLRHLAGIATYGRSAAQDREALPALVRQPARAGRLPRALSHERRDRDAARRLHGKDPQGHGTAGVSAAQPTRRWPRAGNR